MSVTPGSQQGPLAPAQSQQGPLAATGASGAPLRIGTRPSALALAQTELVAQRLRAAGHACELVHVSTPGDRSSAPIAQLGVGRVRVGAA